MRIGVAGELVMLGRHCSAVALDQVLCAD